MPSDPFATKNNPQPASIHDYAQQHAGGQLRTMQDSIRQNTVREWVKGKLGDRLMNGITMEAHNLDGNSGGATPYEHAKSAVSASLKRGGFGDDAIEAYFVAMQQRGNEETIKTINQSITTQQRGA